MTILIDNEHGSDTPGKRSPDGLFREYFYTREIASRVVSELSDCGYDAQLLVPETEDIPLRERLGMPKNNSAGASRIIADAVEAGLIHLSDKAPDSKKYSSYVPYYV